MAYGYLTPRRRGSLVTGGPSGGGLFDLHRQMNRLFDDLFDQDGDSGVYARAGMNTPAMEIHQTDDRLEITAELPGVREEDIDLTVEDGVLTLRGEKKSSREDQERGYSERSYGTFERRLTLPSNIDEEACSADFKDGVLTITLPKAEKARGRRIPLGGGSQPRTIEAQNDREQGSVQQAAEEPDRWSRQNEGDGQQS